MPTNTPTGLETAVEPAYSGELGSFSLQFLFDRASGRTYSMNVVTRALLCEE